MDKEVLKTLPSEEGEISLVTFTNAKGATVELSSLGAGIVKVIVPDAEGKMEDVVLGYADPTAYIGDGPAAGKIPGRYANRIAKGKFTLDGKEYTLPINNGPNCNHGGDHGFHNRNWKLAELKPETCEATFEYVSAAGEAGFPGELTARAHYHWTDENALELTVTATTDAPTVVNLTNHAYWNLAGELSGTVLGHTMQVFASRYLPTDDTLIPSGELAPVAGTPMDFTTPKEIGRDIKADFPALKYGKGYDNCWVLDAPAGELRTAAVITEAGSRRKLEIITDQPAAQIYTGNWLNGCPAGKKGHSFADYDAVAVECQNFPDAPNHDNFPSSVLRPGEEYLNRIVFKFSTF